MRAAAKQKPVARVKPRKRKQGKPVQTQTTALATIQQPPAQIVQRNRMRELRTEEIALLKRTVAKGASDDEFALFLWVARKHKLDPLTRQLHCVARWTNKHHKDEKGIWVGGNQMTIQMGIDGFRSLAARDHKDFGGCDEPEYVMGDRKTPNGKPIPEKASIKLWKKGLDHPVVGVARWDEFAPADLADPEMFMWRKMPCHMLAKCAEALALRKGYPELADIYTDEEMHQAKDGHTPEGRLIVENGADAAQTVAQRLIEKPNSPERTRELIVEAEKAVPDRITITFLDDLTVSLTGNGLGVIKAELTPEDKDELGIKQTVQKGVHMPAANAAKFIDRVAKFNVIAKFAEA